MKIAVIGPGSMGLLYGAGLSKAAEVTLYGNNAEHIAQIRESGITLRRGEETEQFRMAAALNGEGKEPVDLLIVFTKAYLTEKALEANRALIGPDTMLLTLQNGAGHEAVLRSFAAEERVLIGTTAQGSYRENAHSIVNSGLGETAVGAIAPDIVDRKKLSQIRDVFEAAGFPCVISDDIRQMVWNKLMINASSSVLSGVLQVRQGYIVENPDAFAMCRALIAEICETANAAGLHFSAEEQTKRLEQHLKNAPGGYTSIYADLKNGRKTEVDHICGAVVREAAKHGIRVTAQEMMVHMVHAMEGRE